MALYPIAAVMRLEILGVVLRHVCYTLWVWDFITLVWMMGTSTELHYSYEKLDMKTGQPRLVSTVTQSSPFLWSRYIVNTSLCYFYAPFPWNLKATWLPSWNNLNGKSSTERKIKWLVINLMFPMFISSKSSRLSSPSYTLCSHVSCE